MKYDLNQIKIEITALNTSKEMILQQFHKVCGAIELLEAMEKNLSSCEEKNQQNESASENDRCDEVEQKNEDLVQ